MIHIESSEESFGTVEEYASGAVHPTLNRRGYGRRTGFVGFLYMTIDGKPTKITVQHPMQDKYIAPYTPEGSRPIVGSGSNTAKAVKDLAQKLLDKGIR